MIRCARRGRLCCGLGVFGFVAGAVSCAGSISGLGVSLDWVRGGTGTGGRVRSGQSAPGPGTIGQESIDGHCVFSQQRRPTGVVAGDTHGLRCVCVCCRRGTRSTTRVRVCAYRQVPELDAAALPHGRPAEPSGGPVREVHPRAADRRREGLHPYPWPIPGPLPLPLSRPQASTPTPVPTQGTRGTTQGTWATAQGTRGPTQGAAAYYTGY